MKTVLLLPCTFFCLLSLAQDKAAYKALADEAFRLFEQKAYLPAGKKYAEAFAVYGGPETFGDRMDAACAWSMASVPDSAFAQLYRIAREGSFDDAGMLEVNNYLLSLHGDKRWNEVVALIREKRDKRETVSDKKTAVLLDFIYVSDQRYRQQLTDLGEEHGWESPEVKALWKAIAVQDSINLVQVKQILDTRGWLGADEVGEQGNATLFLVIQHADQYTQERYLPMMREAVAQGKAKSSQLALLEDRVALGRGKKQLYGSQIGRNNKTGEFYVQPLEDPDNVDKRRAEMGLGSLSDYTALWNFAWDPETYKQQLPKIEKTDRKQQKAWEKQLKKEAKQK